jgi:cephalosporin hydroxylase
VTLPDCFTKAHLNSSFAGVELSQSWNDLALWEEFFNRANISSVIELGTFRGGMTMFFALQGNARGFSVTSIDNHNHGAPVEQLTQLGATLITMDLLSGSSVVPMRELIALLPKPLVLFCDHGDKPREWGMYVPLLSPGDFAAVHDWGTEFREHNLIPSPEPFMQAECESISSMTRFFSIAK